MSEKFHVLLLTNRDSDNTGDQIIEACDLSLIRAVMKNLGVSTEEYEIESRAAAIVTKAYVASKDPDLLKGVRKTIQKADLVIYGGAPMFNYTYQIFYERTAVVLDLCQEYGVPVIFSAVGIEYYREDNEKCQRITTAVNQPVVKQVTTRDDFESLKKMKHREDMVIDKVSDPAVFAGKIMSKYQGEKKPDGKKKIGIFVLRGYGFSDNGYNFSMDDATKLWLDLIEEIKSKGYDYELISNGHFGDEAFVDHLVRNCGVPAKKAVFNMNSPEQIFEHLSTYDGVVSCRLHPSIVAFSMKIPSVSLLWNMKVEGFYDSIGYKDRVLEVEGITAAKVMETLEKAMEEGVNQDEDFLMSVYRTLFNGIKNVMEKEGEAYTYEELMENMPLFEGTSEKEKQLKLERKFRRAYENYNKRGEALKMIRGSKSYKYVRKVAKTLNKIKEVFR